METRSTKVPNQLVAPTSHVLGTQTHVAKYVDCEKWLSPASIVSAPCASWGEPRWGLGITLLAPEWLCPHCMPAAVGSRGVGLCFSHN